MKTLHGLLTGLLLVVVAEGGAAAPPEQGRNLTAEEQKEVDRLELQFSRHVYLGQFEEAVRVRQRMIAYRAERQGANHWEVIDARLSVERWQRLTRVPERDRAEVVRATQLAAEGEQLEQRLRYREAEAKLREAMDIHQKVLGEQHPDTATIYNNLAQCLDRQSKHIKALPLYQKALAISEKALGERHADTATSYNNLAFCLNAQGKDAEALPLFQKALAIRLKALGEQHPRTATRSDRRGASSQQVHPLLASPREASAFLTRPFPPAWRSVSHEQSEGMS